jgi:hypothetical protein
MSVIFCNKICFYDEELLASRPTPKLENHPLSAVPNCLFNIFAATFHITGHSSICNQRMCHAVVTGTHLSRHIPKLLVQNTFQYYSSINGYDFQKSLLFRIAIQNSKGIWHPHYNTKQEIAKCNFTFSFLRQ